MDLKIDLIGHMDAGDRRRWPGDQDERPLGDLGQRQAATVAEPLMAAPIDALFSSPALRCRQTLQPLADRLGLPIQILPELRETYDFTAPPGWDAPFWSEIHASLGGAYAAGRAVAALNRIKALGPPGRAVVCSHGDLIPALIAYLTGAHQLAPIAPLQRRGGWYTIEVRDNKVQVSTHPAPDGFPQ